MMVPRANAEQRRERRNEFQAGQLFIVDLTSRRHAFQTHGIVLNISKGGMAVQTFRPLVPGHIAEIRASFPRTSLSTGAGVVAWQEKGGLAGIRFLNPPLKNLAELLQRSELDVAPQSSGSALPLSSCRSKSSTSEFDMTLHLFACSVMALTGATGAAIALGDSGGMECRANVGSAPEVGTQLRPERGLSGHSLRTGAAILCADAWSDARVNMAAARQMDTRSILIVPIAMAGNIVGLLQAYAPNPNHFHEGHVRRLQPLVDVLATVPEVETVPKKESLGDVAEPVPVAVAQDIGNTVPEVVPVLEVVEKQEPAPTHFADYARPPRRSRPIGMVVGIAAALLAVIVAAAWFVSRERSKSSSNANSPTATGNVAQPPSAPVSDQGAASTAVLTGMPMISFDPPVIDQKLGATFGVNVVLKGAKDLWSAPMQILYDPQKLQIITVVSGGLLDRDGQAATLVHRTDLSTGKIDVSISRPLLSPGISGDGIVFTLEFVCKASGRSTLRVEQTGLRDTAAKAVPATTSEAVVTITKSAEPAAKDHTQGRAEVQTPHPAASSGSTAQAEPVPRAEIQHRAEAIPISPRASLVVEGAPRTESRGSSSTCNRRLLSILKSQRSVELIDS
jgi:hypothetical protein